MKRFSSWSFLLLCVLFPLTVRADVRVVKNEKGWNLLVDGKPYYVKGVCYEPAKIGESAMEGTLRDWMTVDDDQDGRVDAPYQSWVDVNRNNRQDSNEPVVGDFQLLKEMGANTMRVYHHASASPKIQALHKKGSEGALLYNHAPNKKLLRDLFKTYGIRVAMGDLLGAYVVGSGADWDEGTDYLDASQRKKMLSSVEEMVREFKDEPYILMWVLGNENNYKDFTHTNAAQNPKAYAEFVNQAAQLIKKLDPHHPVALANGDLQLIFAYSKYTPSIDIFGLNSYRDHGFGGMWEQVASRYPKPVLLTEYGTAHPKVKDDVLDEDDHARIHELNYCDMWRHRAGELSPGNSIGGFLYTSVDDWWQDGQPNDHNLGGGGWNHEWNGVMSQGDGSASPFLRQLRKTYFMYQSHWTSEKDLCSEKQK